MLAFYFRYNRFWLKVLLAIIVLAILLFSGAYALLYRYSSFEYLQQQSVHMLKNTKRKASFDADIKRNLFPRPTIILNHFTLSEPDGQTPAARAKEIRIGLGWKSLLGQIEIEKLVINDLVGVVHRDIKGKWNFEDLFQQNQSSNINRIQINNGSIMLQAFGQDISLKEISYSQFRQDNHHFPYTLRAQAQHSAWENLAIRAQGQATIDKGVFTLPDALVQFEGQENKESFSGSFAGNIRFPTGQFQAQQSTFIIDSNRFDFHNNMNIKQITEQANQLQLNDINSVFTATDKTRNYNGTLTIKQTQLNTNSITSPEINLSINAQDSGSDSINASLKGSAQWQRDTGLQMPDVQFNTRQDQSGGLPRFISELNGKIEANDIQNWHIQAQGLFDRHPLTIELKRESDNIDGQLEFTKLNLNNYLNAIEQRAENPYPQWLNNRLRGNILLTINELNLPSLEIHNIRSVLKADEAQIQLSPLVADLYSGHSEGSLTIANGQPVQYTLKQKADGVQIRPLMQDLFRNSSISGKGQADLNFTTTGTNRRELTENLSGSLDINVENGYWHGINIRELMQAATAEGNDEKESNQNNLLVGDNDTKRATPFETFILKSKIQNGISKHRTEANFSIPAVRMNGKGETNLYSGMMNDDISILSNNGKNTLPLRLSGSMDNPSISLNYQKITNGLNTPKEKQEAVTRALQKQWEWIKEQSLKKQQEDKQSEEQKNK